MSISYRTSNDNYDIIVPFTQQQILAMNQNLIPNRNNSYAPIRNHHTFSVLFHDDDHTFYFSPNYSYDTNGIPEYEQVVIINRSSGPDQYSIFTLDEENKTLTINYSI